MRRILLVLTIAAVMVATMAMTAAPVWAQLCLPDISCETLKESGKNAGWGDGSGGGQVHKVNIQDLKELGKNPGWGDGIGGGRIQVKVR